MRIFLQRRPSAFGSTIGELFIDDVHFCYTLEDVVRPEKTKNNTAIFQGRYEIIINWSNRFNKPMPLLFPVPDFTGVRIHSGNTASQTSGCILLGMEFNDNYLINSRKAFDSFFSLLDMELKKGKVYIDIRNAPQLKK